LEGAATLLMGAIICIWREGYNYGREENRIRMCGKLSLLGMGCCRVGHG
jgi:hypothetical protein